MKHKVGSVVVANQSFGPFVKGGHWVVAEELGGFITVENMDGYYHGDNFDPVTRETPLSITADTDSAEMDKGAYLAFAELFMADMLEITKRKNHDYTGTNPDPFANFNMVETAGICSTEQGFLVRMSDKMARITAFVQQGVLKVEDEKIEDTLKDLANYSILLAGYIQSKRQSKGASDGKEEHGYGHRDSA